MKRVRAPSRETRERLTAMTERRLSADEVREALATPLSEAEHAENASLIRWFRRRYPTPGERLAYARRAYRRWSAAQAGRAPQALNRRGSTDPNRA